MPRWGMHRFTVEGNVGRGLSGNDYVNKLKCFFVFSVLKMINAVTFGS